MEEVDVVRLLWDIAPLLALMAVVIYYQARRLDKVQDREIETMMKMLPLLRAVDSGQERLEKTINEIRDDVHDIKGRQAG